MPNQTESVFSKYFYPVGFAMMGAGVPLFQNLYARKPPYTGIQRHLFLGALGFAFGYYVEMYLQKKWAYRDAIIKHYIELHPEDFVEHKRKYKEIFDEWTPIR